MEADAAEDVAARLHPAVSGFLQARGKIVDRNEAADLIGDIRVNARTAVQQKAPEEALRI